MPGMCIFKGGEVLQESALDLPGWMMHSPENMIYINQLKKYHTSLFIQRRIKRRFMKCLHVGKKLFLKSSILAEKGTMTSNA